MRKAALCRSLLLAVVLGGCHGRASTATGISGLTGITSVSAGWYHAMALRQDGTVWTWGWNADGQLGIAPPAYTVASNLNPVQVPGLTEVISTSAGIDHSVALKSDGTVWTWGGNGSGQLGDGTTVSRHSPGQVPGLTDVKVIAAGGYRTAVVKRDGTVWTWGNNQYGSLGDGTKTERHLPVRVPGLTDVVALTTMGEWNSAAVSNDGKVWVWGLDSDGQLGTGQETSARVPARVQSLSAIQAVAMGRFHTLALRSDGTVWSWGMNIFGQLGDGDKKEGSLVPAPIPGLTEVAAIAAGELHSAAVRSDGTLWGWGSTGYGQFGMEPGEVYRTPVQIPGLIGILQVSAGGMHTVALRRDGTVWAAGTYEPIGQWMVP